MALSWRLAAGPSAVELKAMLGGNCAWQLEVVFRSKSYFVSGGGALQEMEDIMVVVFDTLRAAGDSFLFEGAMVLLTRPKGSKLVLHEADKLRCGQRQVTGQWWPERKSGTITVRN